MIDLIEMKTFQYDDKGARVEVEMTPERKEIASNYREKLKEAIALTSEELLEKYMNGEHISRKEAAAALHQGIADNSIVPVYCGAATKMWGIYALLDAFVESFPSPVTKCTQKIVRNGEWEEEEIRRVGEPALLVFKTIADPFVGRFSFFKVMNGELKKDMVLKNITSGAEEKFSKIYTICGKKQTEVDSLACGDIGVIAKLSGTNTNDTLCEKSDTEYAKIVFPEANMTMAIKTEAKDEDKVATAIAKILDEDKTVKYENFVETGELLLKGIGDTHLDTVVCKLKTRYGVSIKLQNPKIAYRETIKKTRSK